MKYAVSAVIAVLCLFSATQAAVYEVKPGTAMDTIAEVPWATLQPGDTVLIHWRSTPYKEKWVICRQGTAQAPITVRGVLGPNGERPVIDGNGATTPTNLNFWSETRGTIKIGGASVPQDTMPKYIVIENLEIRGAHPNYQFTARNGSTQSYSSAASPIFVEKGENITIRNNIITDGANGFFVASTDTDVSRNILVEGNYIYGNGIVDSILQHNNYTAAIGITFQYNRFGPLRTGARGVNLKDRSAGLVVRYNWMEGGNRTIDMVNGEDSSVIRAHPDYNRAHVYGNVLIKLDEPNSNNQVVHFGGDTGDEAFFRQGPLYFYNNTIYSIRAGNTAVMRLSASAVSADARNNIFFNTASGSNLAMLVETGSLTITNNWAKTGWSNSHQGSGFSGSVSGSMLTGSAPGFVDAAAQDFRLSSSGAARDAGTTIHPNASAFPVNRQYVKHQSSEPRPSSGVIDLGAFEYSAAAPVQISNISLPDTGIFRWYGQSLQATGGTGPITWSVVSGSMPRGMWLDASTGRIIGRARLKGTWTFTVEARDSQGVTATRQFTVRSTLHF